jgi:hypothetical protein
VSADDRCAACDGSVILVTVAVAEEVGAALLTEFDAIFCSGSFIRFCAAVMPNEAMDKAAFSVLYDAG